MAQTEPYIEKYPATTEEAQSQDSAPQVHPVKWYRSTFYNAFILGICKDNLLVAVWEQGAR